MPETNEDELVVDLPDSGAQTDVVIDDNSSNGEETISVSSDSEHETYSKKVKTRIDKLTKKAREAERQQEAAISYARNIQAENNALKNQVHSLDQGYVAEYGDRVATQSESIARDLETAIATNDTSSQVDLNQKLARLAIEEERVNTAKQQQAQQQQAQQQQFQQQQAQQQQVQQPAQVPVRPDPKAETWANRNEWFGEDNPMTFAAFGIHKTLVDQEGFDTNSPDYYDEIDRRMHDAFPHKFNGHVGNGGTVSVSDSRRPQQAVASAVRSSHTGRKSVRLSPSEVAIARKLGVPLDEYAKHKTS